MTNIMSRQQRRLKERGLSEEQARMIAYKTQLKKGNLVPGSFRLSEQGIEYSSLNSLQRKEIRKGKNNFGFGFN